MKTKNSKSFLFIVAVLLPLIALAQISGPQNYANVIMTFLRATTAAGARSAIGAAGGGVGSEAVNFDTTQFTVATITNLSIVSGALHTNSVLKGSTSGSWTVGATGNLTADTARTITTTTGALALTTGAANGDITLVPQGTGKVGIGTASPSTLLSAITTVSGGQLPTSGTTPTKSIINIKASAGNSMYLGMDSGSPFSGWIQVADASAGLGNFYPIALNPNGGNVGVGTYAPDRAQEINSSTGANLRLTYNDSNGSASTYVDFSTTSAGFLTIAPSGLTTTFTSTTEATTGGAGSLTTAGGIYVAKKIVTLGGVLQRSDTVVSSATPTFNTDNVDIFTITALAAAANFANANITGTPVNGQSLKIRIKDNATPRALTWESNFEGISAALPATTVASKRMYIGFIWDSTASKWGMIALANEI